MYFTSQVRQLVNMGVEGIYFEDDQETIYAGSVIVPSSYKSRPSSGIYVNSQGLHSEPIILGNGDLCRFLSFGWKEGGRWKYIFAF